MSAFVWRPNLANTHFTTASFWDPFWFKSFEAWNLPRRYLQKYTASITHTTLLMLSGNNGSVHNKHLARTRMCEQVLTCLLLEGGASWHDYNCTGCWYQCNNAAIVDVGVHLICKGQVRISADVLTILIDISRDFPEFLQANALICLQTGHDHFVPRPFSFVIRWSSSHSTQNVSIYWQRREITWNVQNCHL